jgi:hypothetical protein
MASKDERVKCVTEAITGIRVLKYHVWEDHFIQKIKSKIILDDFNLTCFSFLPRTEKLGTKISEREEIS